DIQYDPEQEVSVSREHGKIVKVTAEPPQFSIIDNNSRNGIFVNKTRVKGSATLNPGDEVQLGSNGPVFAFDIYPRPQNMMMETKIMDIPTSIKATTISEIGSSANASSAAEPVKTGLGKQTVERMLVAERKKSYGTMGIIIGLLVVTLGVLGYVFRDNIFGPKTVIDPKTAGKKTTDEIARENDEKVVQIEFGWQLYDTRTKEEYIHEFTQIADEQGQARWMGIYIQNGQGKIEPYLSTKRNSRNGIPISVYGASGSGFVVGEDGYILTNRHVGAGWNTRWSFPDFAFPGLLFTGYDNKGNMVFDKRPVQAEEVFGWVPANAKMAEGRPVAPGTIKGDNTYMFVVFSGTTDRRQAHLELPSADHDVALIKVNIPTSLKKVTMLDNYDKVEAGQTVTIMGYPAIAPQTIKVKSSKDPFNPEWNSTTAPTPTVTPGTIGRIVPASSMKDLTMSESGFGDSYQLTANATGGGNSGGPVYDDKGNVIGIFYASSNDGQTKITFAVPIKYGLELMSVKKAK
ncbi:MAG: trypsin-like peptidase domain-containing protein, partial [Ferruginibacter sp.]